MKNETDWPKTGDYVIITVNSINPNSVFADLDEYPRKRGMIHISEASTKWVQDLRQHFKVGQKGVAKVIAVDVHRGHISLSLKRVKPTSKRDKTAEWKNEKKAINLMSFVAKELSMPKEEIETKASRILQERFDLVYPGFEIAATDGAGELVDMGIDKKIAEKMEEIAKKNIKPKEVEIKGILKITVFSSNGVETIKDALKTGKKNIIITYSSSPKYLFTAKGKDFPSLEKEVSAVTENIIEKIQKAGGNAEFVRA